MSENYIDCDFPELTKNHLLSLGSQPLRAIVWRRGNDVSVGLLSADPSGPNGKMERHLSISASTKSVRREPNRREIGAAISKAWIGDYVIEKGNDQVVHIYEVTK